jgi:hypothetical protein
MTRVLLGHRETLARAGESLRRRLVDAQAGSQLALDQLWREGQRVRQSLDQACCAARPS